MVFISSYLSLSSRRMGDDVCSDGDNGNVWAGCGAERLSRLVDALANAGLGE